MGLQFAHSGTNLYICGLQDTNKWSSLTQPHSTSHHHSTHRSQTLVPISQFLTLKMAAPFPSPTSMWHTTTYDAISPTRPELSAKGNTVLVTGGGTGIGAETARYFAKAGASRIALLGRREQPLLDTKKAIEKEFPDAEVFVASTDITNKEEVDSAFAKFLGDRKLDVVVSNAATIGPQDPVKDADAERFLDAIQQNLRGAMFVAQAFLRHASDRAVAINVSSSVAHLDFGPGFASYGVAKMAIVRLWNSVAFANPDLSVFHIQPGVVDTAMNREAGGVKAMGFADDGEWDALCVAKITCRLTRN
ncbi:hypothetical protein BCR34DRAFT_558738 [Clohesyomyces aquaticus]|uniref:Ketoreductase domain-containing protein n=1 Tax=Clohesyomyces aquaticus TaxID=1231657 RepID=A0A1Y1ZYU6_9PLEO|nr:hypothetical protein BCR34DRAFT_558738 [Clohesyomyces aquaticus]